MGIEVNAPLCRFLGRGLQPDGVPVGVSCQILDGWPELEAERVASLHVQRLPVNL